MVLEPDRPVVVAMIVAIDEAGIIGHHGQGMPWRLPADLAQFRHRTWGKPIVMGRHTFATLSRALPGRTNIVLTRDLSHWPMADPVTLGIQLVASWPEAWDRADEQAKRDGQEELFVIGGAQLYNTAWPQVQRAYITRVPGEHPDPLGGPPICLEGLNDQGRLRDWNLVSETIRAADARTPCELRFQRWDAPGLDFNRGQG